MDEDQIIRDNSPAPLCLVAKKVNKRAQVSITQSHYHFKTP